MSFIPSLDHPYPILFHSSPVLVLPGAGNLNISGQRLDEVGWRWWEAKSFCGPLDHQSPQESPIPLLTGGRGTGAG